MKRVYAHHPEGGEGESVAAMRDDESGEAFCIGCQLLIASDDLDEQFGLPLGRAVYDHESGWLITLCPDCRARFPSETH